ncbi:hypothetical protein DWZ39_09205 [Bacteroides fragilis]|nr:hypothetical protein DXD74_13340 [Bacteroides fragilis]RHM86322.1 hypothetical protein DWZ39_09205 [Bacteroides fragilis]
MTHQPYSKYVYTQRENWTVFHWNASELTVLLEGKQHSFQPVSARAHRLKLVGFVQTRVIRYIHNP